jgi:hypothetical protein
VERGWTYACTGDAVSRRPAWEPGAGAHDDDRRPRSARPLPTTALWRWRYEVVVTSGVSGGVAGLVQALGANSTVALVAATGAAMVSTPWVRRMSARVWWHVVTPHLFRRCCSDLGFRDGRGRLPAVLRTRTTRRGQRLTVWCSAGVSLKDLRRAREELDPGALGAGRRGAAPSAVRPARGRHRRARRPHVERALGRRPPTGRRSAAAPGPGPRRRPRQSRRLAHPRRGGTRAGHAGGAAHPRPRSPRPACEAGAP